jgi:S1-C subfamily serine protease
VVEAKVIVELDGEPARTVDALIVRTLELKPGDIVHVTYEPRGAARTTALELSAG